MLLLLFACIICVARVVGLELEVEEHYRELSRIVLNQADHLSHLQQLKSQGFEPKVIYDIGSCALHFTHQAKVFWPNATYVLFDAIPFLDKLYEDYEYFHLGVLSDKDYEEKRFYMNIEFPGGNSYY